MNARAMLLGVVAAAFVGAAGYGIYSLGMNRGMQMSSPAAAAAPAQGTAAADTSGRRVLYWHDPMVPGHRFDKPGKSPFMDMDLVPVYADEGDATGGVAISPRVQQNLGVRIAEAALAEVAPAVQAVGTVAYNERDVALVQARANGFLEKLHVRAPLDRVARGQPLAELYVPEWVAVQEEYLVAARLSDPSLAAMRDGALQRMRLAGMSEEQIQRVVQGGKVQARMTLVSPIGGVVSELSAREGMTVMAGAPLFRINGLGTIWVNAEVPESLAAHVRPGNAVEARAAAFPGRAFKGKVSAILPEVNAATRTLKARVELGNPGGELVPGMFVNVDFAAAAKRQVLTVPSEAVIQTGKRTVVVVAEAGEDGKQHFRPAEVEAGAEANGRTEIRKGLTAGERVVVSGQFLIDSEANLKATEARMQDAPVAAAAKTHRAEGKVEDVGEKSVTLSHGAIPTAGMGAMTMEFQLAGPRPAGVATGADVAFEFEVTPQGEYRIVDIRPRVKGKP
jgi:membrane fusion protein, copper/silver efflux system